MEAVVTYFHLRLVPGTADATTTTTTAAPGEAFLDWAAGLCDAIEFANGDSLSRFQWPLQEASFGFKALFDPSVGERKMR